MQTAKMPLIPLAGSIACCPQNIESMRTVYFKCETFKAWTACAAASGIKSVNQWLINHSEGSLGEQVALGEKWVDDRIEDWNEEQHQQRIEQLHMVRLDLCVEQKHVEQSTINSSGLMGW